MILAIPAGIEAGRWHPCRDASPAGQTRGCSLRSPPGYMLESWRDMHVAPVPIFFPHPDTRIHQIKL